MWNVAVNMLDMNLWTTKSMVPPLEHVTESCKQLWLWTDSVALGKQ